jgi:hypothetical protein
MSSQEKYGSGYKQARKEKMSSQAVPADEVTYSTQDLETHHSQPKMFNGPDVKENLIILCRDFHAYIHQICNVKDNDLIYKRLALSKKIRSEPNSMSVEGSKKRLDEIDSVLMREYIQNMILNVSQNYKEKVIEITMLSQMQTIKTQAIEIMQLKDQLQKEKDSKSFKTYKK